MTIAEQIYSIVKNLPQDQASEILAFAEFVRSKHSINVEHGSGLTHDQTVASLPWVELVHSLAGAWADDFPSLEAIRAEEGQDVLRESL